MDIVDAILKIVLAILILVGNFFVYIFYQKITWLTIAGVAISILFYKGSIRYKKSREGLLTFKLRQEFKKSCKQKEPSSVKVYLEQLYLPSWQSVLFVLIVGTILFFLAHITKFNILFGSLEYVDGNHYQNLIAIHAGIGAIIFALLIFIAESLRDDETKDRARVLLKESFLFPLTVIEIIGFFVFIWGNVNVWAILTPLIVASLTIASLWRLLLVLLSKSRFAKKRLQLLKDRVKRSIDSAISERFGNNILSQGLGEEKIELSYNPFSLDSKEEVTRHSFYADRVGIIIDIRLNKLDEFAKLVEQEANKNGFSFYKDKAKQEDTTASSDTAVAEANTTRFLLANRQFLHKKFRDEIDQADQALISIEKRVIKDPEVLKELTRLVKDIFVIKKQDNFSEEIKLEIDGLEDQFITAVEAKKLCKIKELVKTYISLSETFLESLNTYGGGYSYEQARRERGEIMGGWNEIRWLSESIREIYVKATQSHDQEIIGDVAYLPVAIAIRAIKAGDQYIYQEFLKFPSYLYWLALKEENKDVQAFMVDRSWRHLREMSDYYIEYQLKHKASDVDLIKKYRDFTIPIFVAFQNLLKTAFDKGDFDSFQAFLNKFLGLYHDFDPDKEHPNAEYLKQSLGWTQDSVEKGAISRKIEVQEEKEKAAKDIQLKKRQVIFGLSAWIFEKYRNTPSAGALVKFYNDIVNRLPNTLPELTELYVSSRQFETEHLWDWDNWEMIPDGGAHFIDFNSKLDRLYCITTLLVLKGMTEEAIDSITLPHSRDLAYLAEDRPNSNTLINMLDAIIGNSSQWGFILSQPAIEKISALKTLLTKAKIAQEKSEEEYLKTVKIDPDKLREFRNKVKDSFHESGYLRPVLKEFGIYKNLVSELPGTKIPLYGYNQIDEKAAFIKDWHVYYSGWGENYGQGMASSEDQLIFERMVDGAGIKKDVAKQDVISEIEKILNENKLKNPIVLQTLDHMYEYDQLRTSEAFISRYTRDCPKTNLDAMHGYMGILKIAGQNVPIINIFVRRGKLKNKVIITDLSSFGVLNQYSPIDKLEDAECQYDIFFIRVTDLNQDEQRRQKIITDNPFWLQEHEDGEGYLKQKALINLYQKFEFEIKNPKSAYSLNVGDLPATDDEEE
ncbi:MAG: hypothetical protein UT42_C0001G0019 [Candidatus Falkowbacteria bacterium GW2011_GWA2_39_24]|uniref:Uncharacterized protein n=1 Tax=Candidatus Falkowbacteria bacterium GW2011_GWA2_39_24 TaxID=1618634 RepID=A0A0G0RPF1_9BACT|nr:MAG: hypothetical protein UT42_C0001G0019 [Candidatus Falkowbacteria bacterium GW2011_GWA2_39_24]